MAGKYFAKLDTDNTVLNVHILLEAHAATEAKGAEWLKNAYGHAKWKQCYKKENPNPRKNYPCLVTMKYEESIDAFIEKISPYPSWTLNSSTGKYEAPAVKVEKADDGVDATCPIPQYWDEASGSWKLDDYTVVGELINL
jgi:hypothetical protein